MKNARSYSKIFFCIFAQIFLNSLFLQMKYKIVLGLVMAFGLAASAETANYNGFTFLLKGGGEIKVNSTGLTMKIVEGTLQVIPAAGEMQTISLSDLESFAFSDGGSGVQSAALDELRDLDVFTMNGVRLGHFQEISAVPSGTYIIVTGEKAQKVIIP